MNIRATNLVVGFDKIPVTQQIDLSVDGGTILAIAGPNGAGKSTLLKTLARLLKPISGQVNIDGRDISSITPREFAQQVSYVPQSQQLEQDLTVEELVALGRNPHQAWWSWYASSDDRNSIEGALRKTSTWDFRNKYLSTLSGGERQRALIATALAQQPKFILLDEPISHLDFRHQLELIELLESLKNQGIGVITVLHDLNIIAKLADYVLLLEKTQAEPSKPVAHGAPKEVLAPALLKQVFGVNVHLVDDPVTSSKVYVSTL